MPRCLAMLAMMLAGCGSNPFDPCAAGETIEVLGPIAAETWGETALLADAEGYALFWTHAAAGEGGVWATRPGDTAVRLSSDGNPDQSLAVVTVADGFLVCWSDRAQSVGDSRPGQCFTTDSSFAIIGAPTRPDFGPVDDAGRAGAVIAARTRDDVSGQDLLFAIDASGNPSGAPVPWPCELARVFTWAPAGVACLLPSDPQCGTQFDERTDCVNDLHVYDLTGTRQLLVPAVAPYGVWNQWTEVHVAAHASGYLVSWIDVDGWHAQAFDPAGVPGLRIDQGNIAGGSALFSTDTGYVALWSESNQSYELPRLLRLEASGNAGVPEWVTDPGGDLTRQYAYNAAAAGTDGGVAVAWAGAGGLDASDYVSGLRFRALGCSAP